MNGSLDESKLNVVTMFLKSSENHSLRKQLEDIVVGQSVVRTDKQVDMKESLQTKFGLGIQN